MTSPRGHDDSGVGAHRFDRGQSRPRIPGGALSPAARKAPSQVLRLPRSLVCALGLLASCASPTLAPVTPSPQGDPEPFTPGWDPSDRSGATLTLQGGFRSAQSIAERTVRAIIDNDQRMLRELIPPAFYFSGSGFRSQVPLERLFRLLDSPRRRPAARELGESQAVRARSSERVADAERFPRGAILVEIRVTNLAGLIWRGDRAFVLIDPTADFPVIGL